jgi:hypothetical protein
MVVSVSSRSNEARPDDSQGIYKSARSAIVPKSKGTSKTRAARIGQRVGEFIDVIYRLDRV